MNNDTDMNTLIFNSDSGMEPEPHLTGFSSLYPNQQDANALIQHLHIACLHEYVPGNHDPTEQFKLGVELIGSNQYNQPTVHVLEPRWCPLCRSERVQTLKARLQQRLVSFSTAYQNIMGVNNGEHDSRDRIERAYITDVVRGRIQAIEEPLEQNEDLSFVNDRGEESDLSSVMRNSTLTHNTLFDTTSAEGIINDVANLVISPGEIGNEARIVFAE